ncbi:MAG TPA: hypothetical protein VEU77_02580 [Candidatus Acidoferrales bacterium]|nr:hypothetical protein [Candidatus Acidoferrales bacterium]
MSDRRYDAVKAALLARRGVSVGEGFGGGALTVGGRIFAMRSARGDYVVRLPRDRVAALIASGDGKAFDAGRGRVMKEWLAVNERSRIDWTVLADETRVFVARAK